MSMGGRSKNRRSKKVGAKEEPDWGAYPLLLLFLLRQELRILSRFLRYCTSYLEKRCSYWSEIVAGNRHKHSETKIQSNPRNKNYQLRKKKNMSMGGRSKNRRSKKSRSKEGARALHMKLNPLTTVTKILPDQSETFFSTWSYFLKNNLFLSRFFFFNRYRNIENFRFQPFLLQCA